MDEERISRLNRILELNNNLSDELEILNDILDSDELSEEERKKHTDRVKVILELKALIRKDVKYLK